MSTIEKTLRAPDTLELWRENGQKKYENKYTLTLHGVNEKNQNVKFP